METGSGPVERGDAAFEGRSWEAARESLAAAREAGALDAAGLWRLGVASYLTGREADFVRVLKEAEQAALDAGAVDSAARHAFWLGVHLAERGDFAQASGWFGRATRHVEAAGDCAERGYLLLPRGRRQLVTGEYDGASRDAAEAAAIGKRFGDADLVAMALHLQGRAMLRAGRVDAGLALLDEVMVGVITDHLTPIMTGILYCSVIGACREVWAVSRAQEWTEALAEWCRQQPDMIAYSGECHVYRAELLRMRGEWTLALDEARRASSRFDHGSEPDATGLALYQQAEVQRLRGEYAAAEETYAAASRAGCQVQPGLALLRLAQGAPDKAAAALRRALAETSDPFKRSRLLPAFIDVMLANGDIPEAKAACTELNDIASRCATGLFDAVVLQARGAIELAAGNAEAALEPLREAWRAWERLNAPWDVASVRVLIGTACGALGDAEGAQLELDAARAEFERIGASPEVARLDRIRGRDVHRDHGLTPREREVLALVATGRGNREISKELSISARTVERHLANIFLKLGLSTRAAATAYAWEHGLLDPSA